MKLELKGIVPPTITPLLGWDQMDVGGLERVLERVPLNVIFGAFAGVALLSVVVVLLIKPRKNMESLG